MRRVAANMQAQNSPDRGECVGAEFFPFKPLAKTIHAQRLDDTTRVLKTRQDEASIAPMDLGQPKRLARFDAQVTTGEPYILQRPVTESAYLGAEGRAG